MTPIHLFISSVQKELAKERAVLRDWLRNDALMRRFFEPFLFEDVPAADRRADELYLDEVERCDVYVGLFGNDYGSEDDEGISPTECEFDQATALHKTRLVFIKGVDDAARHPKMRTLVRKAEDQLVRGRFATSAELIMGVYAALVQYLEEKQLIRFGPFDASVCHDATLADLSVERIRRFVGIARGREDFHWQKTPTCRRCSSTCTCSGKANRRMRRSCCSAMHPSDSSSRQRSSAHTSTVP